MSISFLAELQKILDLVVALLMEGVARVAVPAVVIADDETASTNGKSYVRMPNEFLGVPIQDQMSNAIGLLAHEIGHWLQPLDQINEVEKVTGLDHGVVNLLLDIQLEENIARIMPLFRRNLIGVRNDIGKHHKKEYVDDLKKAEKEKDFFSAVVNGLLLGRFCGDTSCSYSTTMFSNVKEKRLFEFLLDATRFMDAHPAHLPNMLRRIANKYPELCHPRNDDGDGDSSSECVGGDGPLNPTSVVSSGSVDELRKFIQSAIVLYQGSADCKSREDRLSGSIPPAPDVLSASRRIQLRWEVPRASGSVMGPGRMNRLAAVRGDPIPFDFLQSSGKTKPKVQVVLVADWSGSMQGVPWYETRRAAQAVTLAIRSVSGDVRGAIFEDFLMHTKDFSAEIFFSTRVGSLNISDAQGNYTSFGWLPLIWQKFPKHRVVLLTDGNGMTPHAVPVSCRRRTSAILLKVNDDSIRSQVESTVNKFAERFVHVNNLDEIATAWSLVIPRLAQ
jgi:hypothetical protein